MEKTENQGRRISCWALRQFHCNLKVGEQTAIQSLLSWSLQYVVWIQWDVVWIEWHLSYSYNIFNDRQGYQEQKQKTHVS